MHYKNVRKGCLDPTWKRLNFCLPWVPRVSVERSERWRWPRVSFSRWKKGNGKGKRKVRTKKGNERIIKKTKEREWECYSLRLPRFSKKKKKKKKIKSFTRNRILSLWRLVSRKKKRKRPVRTGNITFRKMFGNLIWNFEKVLCSCLYITFYIPMAYAFSVVRKQPRKLNKLYYCSIFNSGQFFWLNVANPLICDLFQLN